MAGGNRGQKVPPVVGPTTCNKLRETTQGPAKKKAPANGCRISSIACQTDQTTDRAALIGVLRYQQLIGCGRIDGGHDAGSQLV